MPEEMTNQSIDTTSAPESSDFSFDAGDFNTNESDPFQSEAKETEVTPEETQTEPAEEEPFLNIRYNGADEALTREQAIELAQKGRNYDKILNRLETLQNDPVRQLIEQQAQNAGLDVNTYVERLNQLQERSNLNRIAQQYKQSHPGVDDNAALEYAQLAYEQQKSAKQAEQAQRLQTIQNEKQQVAAAQVMQFAEEYPDVDITKLPREVLERINAGETLMSAYHAYENAELKKTIATLRRNEGNKAKSVGKVSANNADDIGSDPFLAGLLGKD